MAFGVLLVDRLVGPAQQRINVRWVDGLSDTSRQAAEAALALRDGEATSSADTWVYSLTDRSRGTIRRLVADPRVIDTAHLDRERFRVEVDAPRLPVVLRRLLEMDLGWLVSLGLAGLGAVLMWPARREAGRLVGWLVLGTAAMPRAGASVPAVQQPVLRAAASLLLAVQDEWDWWASRAYPLALGAVLAVTLAFTGWHGLGLAETWDAWSIADWLVTYTPGFVRRGLGGELMLGVSRLVGAPVNVTVWAMFTAVSAIFCGAFLWVLRGRRLTFWFLALCLAPGFLLFTFYNPETVGRKDSLLLASFTVWAAATRTGVSRLSLAVVFAVVAGVCTLMHEAYAFFTPYFVLLSYVQHQERQATGRWWVSLLIPAGAAVALLVVAGASGSLADPALCARLMAVEAPARVCEGVLSYGHESIAVAVSDFRGALSWPALVEVGQALAATALLPLLVVVTLCRDRRTAPRVALAVGGLLICSAPLFVLALDWGRWLSLHASLLTIIAAVLLPDRAVWPHRPRATLRSFVAVAAGVLVLASMFSYGVKYCCRATLVQPWTPVGIVSDTWDRLEF